MTIKYDLSTTLQPYPIPVPENERELSDLDELGSLLVRRSISPHASVSAGIAGNVHLPFSGNMFTPTNGVQAAHEAIIRLRGERGIVRLTPDDDDLSAYDGVAEDIGLLNGFRVPEAELLQQDKNKTLVMSSPNGVSGRIATLQEVVRMARHFQLVVIDERLPAFSMRRLIPLVMEWENVVFVQRFPFIMPRQTADIGWIVHPTELRDGLSRHTEPVPEESIADVLRFGGTNTFSAARQSARLKSQLFREMRKLSIVSVPYPSWSNSLLLRVERGDRDEIVHLLADRDIDVYTPPHANLLQHFRVTAVSEEATISLRDALVEINLELERE